MSLTAGLAFHVRASTVSFIIHFCEAYKAIDVVSYKGRAFTFECVAEVKTMAWSFVAGRALRNGQPVCFWSDRLHKNGGARRSAVDGFPGTVLVLTVSTTFALAIVRLLLTMSVGGSLIRGSYHGFPQRRLQH